MCQVGVWSGVVVAPRTQKKGGVVVFFLIILFSSSFIVMNDPKQNDDVRLCLKCSTTVIGNLHLSFFEDGFRSKYEQYVQKLFTKNLLTAW